MKQYLKLKFNNPCFKRKLYLFILFGVGIGLVALLFPEIVSAQLFASNFESRMKGLTNQLMTVILPMMSVLGLVYAVLLALAGDGGAKGRIIMVIVCSLVGFLAPHIISWFQSAVGF